MLKITEEKDQLTIREIPVGLWIGSFIATIFLFFLINWHFSSETETASKILWISGLILCIVGVISLIIINPPATVRVNRQSKVLSVGKHGIFNSTFNVYSFNEIADLIYVNEFGNGKNASYQLKLPLTNGQIVNLSATIASREGELFRAADLMNAYIFDSPDEKPFKLTVLYEN